MAVFSGTSSNIITVSLTLCLLYYALKQTKLYFTRRRFQKSNGCQPAQVKYPLKDPIFGLGLVLDTIKNTKNLRHLEGTSKRYEQHGTTFTSKLITYPTVFTIDTENVKTILATNFDDFRLSSVRVNAMKPVFGHGIFTTNEKLCHNSRAFLRPTFAKESISNLEVAEMHCQRLINRIHREGSTIDLQDLFFKFTIDTATQFLFGHSVNSQSNSDHSSGGVSDAEFVEQYTYTQLEASYNVRLGPLARFRYNPTANRAQKTVFNKTETEDVKAGPYVFLEETAKLTTDRQVLRDQVLNTLLAGRDTTASLLSNLVFMPARYPNVWRKLRAEVMQRRKDLFGEDVETFGPERWDQIRPKWEFLPFNGGPRICLG
ncbi:uncharacterized protein EAF01_009118 [Botrytis porri]|uniref:uncharacterized protein n=1 Tax=Botrytis porri TaxID=87229 RepID=UPI0019028E2A|nr:uncharacterized protein EAF01_009118 [Botrytis porri]KAF7896715.1 hypothetical protein EAF01_009118 [Botrytis porri]